MKQDFAGFKRARACRSVGRSSPLQGEGPGFESQQVHWINYDSQIIKCTRQVMLPGKDGCAQSPIFGHYEIMYKLHIRRSLDKVRWTLVIMPSGGWLGSSADEGRAKLR